jgi:hypothetical protein
MIKMDCNCKSFLSDQCKPNAFDFQKKSWKHYIVSILLALGFCIYHFQYTILVGVGSSYVITESKPPIKPLKSIFMWVKNNTHLGFNRFNGVKLEGGPEVFKELGCEVN